MSDKEILAHAQALLCDDSEQIIRWIIERNPKKPFEWSTYHIEGVYPDDRARYEKEHGKFPDGELNPDLDDAWQEELESGNYARETAEWGDIWDYVTKDVTTYPGESHSYELGWGRHRDQVRTLDTFKGSWVNKHDYAWDLWLEGKLEDYEMDDNPLLAWNIQDLRDLYVWLVGFDEIMTTAWFEKEITYRLLWQRARWEEEYEPEPAEDDDEDAVPQCLHHA